MDKGNYKVKMKCLRIIMMVAMQERKAAKFKAALADFGVLPSIEALTEFEMEPVRSCLCTAHSHQDEFSASEDSARGGGARVAEDERPDRARREERGQRVREVMRSCWCTTIRSLG